MSEFNEHKSVCQEGSGYVKIQFSVLFILVDATLSSSLRLCVAVSAGILGVAL